VPDVTGSSRCWLRVAGGVLALILLAGCGSGSADGAGAPGSTVTSSSGGGAQPADPNGRRACVLLGDVVAGERTGDLSALDAVAAAAAQATDAGVRTAGDQLAQRLRLARGSAGQPDERLRQAVEDMRRACAEIGLD
jgi:hypothetical protein